MISIYRKLKQRVVNSLILLTEDEYWKSHDKLAVVQAQILSELFRKKQKINDLSEIEFSVYSQWGEDGIIDWLLNHLDNIPSTFVEFGVENYREANTRCLVTMRNWKGLIIDGSTISIEYIQSQQLYWKHSIKAVQCFITAGNIQDTIHDNGFSGNVGVLSIDIDGNDYWVWKAIDCINPVIVICEYNAVFGDLYSITVPYNPEFRRNIAHSSNLYFGASIKALQELANEKGYTFIGTNRNGVNAFFVRNDAVKAIVSNIKYVTAYPSLTREARDEAGNLTYKDGQDRLRIIQNMPIYDLSTGKVVSISCLGELSSSEWLAGKPTFSLFDHNTK
jgi:hypothetical protein